MFSACGCKPDFEGLGILHGKTASLNGEDGREGWFWWALIRSGAVFSFLTCVSPKVFLTPPFCSSSPPVCVPALGKGADV